MRLGTQPRFLTQRGTQSSCTRRHIHSERVTTLALPAVSATSYRIEITSQNEVSIRGIIRQDSFPVTNGLLSDGLPLLDAVSLLGNIDANAAAVLIDLGAVYTGREIKGQVGKVVWDRCLQEDAANQCIIHTEGSQMLLPGCHIRVHPEPKRFPACADTDWPSRVVHMDEELLVLNKPADLLCMRHESNSKEEVSACAAAALGLTGLEVCHRLDQFTTGVLLLSRTKEANRRVKIAMQGREVSKTYKALTATRVPLGRLRHFMYDGPVNEGSPVLGGGTLRQRGPRLLSASSHQGWKETLLEVEDCQPLEVHPGSWLAKCTESWKDDAAAGASLHTPDSNLLHKDCTETDEPQANSPTAPSTNPSEQSLLFDLAPTGSIIVYESRIRLMTGRTHQIRAQLSAAGHPLLGDILYAPLLGFLVDHTAVVQDRQMVSLIEGLPMVAGPIGLHAWSVTWGQRTWVAPAPWDRTETGVGVAGL